MLAGAQKIPVSIKEPTKCNVFIRTPSRYCSTVFIMLEDLLGVNFTDPPGYPIDIYEYHMVMSYVTQLK